MNTNKIHKINLQQTVAVLNNVRHTLADQVENFTLIARHKAEIKSLWLTGFLALTAILGYRSASEITHERSDFINTTNVVLTIGAIAALGVAVHERRHEKSADKQADERIALIKKINKCFGYETHIRIGNGYRPLELQAKDNAYLLDFKIAENTLKNGPKWAQEAYANALSKVNGQ